MSRRLCTLIAFAAALLVQHNAKAELPAPGSTYHLLFASTNFYEITPNQSYPPSGMEFGNIAGADWQMTYSAANAGLPGMENWNGIEVRYLALLSQAGNTLQSRLVVDGPVYNTHGTLLATSRGDILDTSILAPVDYDEYGNYILFDPDVWTGSSGSGFWSGESCDRWNNPSLQGRIGHAFSSNLAWISDGLTKSCAQTARLYGISPALIAPLWGDFDENGSVDGQDFLVWQRAAGQPDKPWDTSAYRGAGVYGSMPNPANNLSLPIDTDAAYLALWQQYYGESLPVSPLRSVPEPSGILLVAVGAFGILARQR